MKFVGIFKRIKISFAKVLKVAQDELKSKFARIRDYGSVRG